MQNEENLEDLYIKLVKVKLQKHWKVVGGIIFLFTTTSLIASFFLPPTYSLTYGFIIGSTCKYQYCNTSSPLESVARIRSNIHLDDKFVVKEIPPYLEISIMGNSEEDVRLKAQKAIEEIVDRHATILEKKKSESLITKQIKHLENELAKEEEVARMIGRFSVDSVTRAMYTIYIKERNDKASERSNELYLLLDENFTPTTIEYEEGPKKLSPSTAQSATIGFLFGILASIFYLYFKKDPDITKLLTATTS